MEDISIKEDANMSEVIEGEYRGSAMLIIRNTPQDKFPFQFGIRKAKLILEHLEDIKQFVQKQSQVHA
jgi:hypothetical protein